MSERDWKRMLKTFARRMKRWGEKEARKYYREQLGLIYVKRHVVEAYFMDAKPKKQPTTRIVSHAVH